MVLSVDLRKRVIAAIDGGIQIDEVVKTFQVCKRVIYNWLALREKTGNLAPKTGYQKGHSPKITDWDLFKKFAENNNQFSSPQMAARWNTQTGSDVSDDVILKALKKIGYTSKKKLLTTPKQAKKNVKHFWKKSKI